MSAVGTQAEVKVRKMITMRKHYLDNIRWITVVIVLFYHVNYLFNTVGIPFPVGEDAGVRFMDTFSYIVYPWFMALLFVIAGMSARYALEHQTARAFLKSKVQKLLVPSTLGLFVLHWTTGWMNVHMGADPGVLDEVPAVIRYLIYTVSGIGPLWFIQMLFLYSLLLVGIRALDKDDKLWMIGGRAGIPVLALLAVVVWGSAQILNMPVLTTYRFGIYGVCYLIGYFVFSHEEVEERVERMRIPALLAAVVLGAWYVVSYYGESFVTPECLQSLLVNAYLWAAVLAILGCGRAWGDRTNRFCDYMTRTSFGLYIVHYPIVLATCIALYRFTNLPHLLNYFIAWAIELPLSFLVYEGLRRIPVIRFLVLGVKKQAKGKCRTIGSAA